MKLVRRGVQARLDGVAALVNEISNDSPLGGKETDVVVTVQKSNGDLIYFVQVAPTKDYPDYQTAFKNVMDSVKLP